MLLVVSFVGGFPFRACSSRGFITTFSNVCMCVFLGLRLSRFRRVLFQAKSTAMWHKGGAHKGPREGLTRAQGKGPQGPKGNGPRRPKGRAHKGPREEHTRAQGKGHKGQREGPTRARGKQSQMFSLCLVSTKVSQNYTINNVYFVV